MSVVRFPDVHHFVHPLLSGSSPPTLGIMDPQSMHFISYYGAAPIKFTVASVDYQSGGTSPTLHTRNQHGLAQRVVKV